MNRMDHYEINVDGVNNRKKIFYQNTNQQVLRKETTIIDSGQTLQEAKQDIDKLNYYPSSNISKNESYNYSEASCLMKQSSIQQNFNTINQVEVKDEYENTKAHINQETELTSKSIYNSPSFRYSRNDKFSERRLSRLAQSKKSIIDNRLNLNLGQQNGSIIGLKSCKVENIDQKLKTFGQTVNEKENSHVEKESQEIKIVTFYYIYKFLKVNLLNWVSHNHRLLTAKQYQIINDRSVIIKKNQEKDVNEQIYVKHNNILEKIAYLRNNQFQIQINQHPQNNFASFVKQIGFSLIYIIKNILGNLKIIKPNNLFLVIWDILFIFNSLFLIIIYPFYISFDQDGDLTYTLKQLQSISLISIVFDIFLGFNTGIYEFGEIVLNREKIYRLYILQRLFTDLISISLLMIAIFQEIEIMTFAALIFRYKQMIEKISRVSCNLQIKQKLSAYYDLIKLIGYISLVIHFFGCGFYYVGIKSNNSHNYQENWIINVGLENKGIFDKYVFSIYFIMITMMTIGYGDITPINKVEKMYTMSVAFITCGLFAFTVNLIGALFTEIQKKYNEFSRKQAVISKYLINRQIDNSTQIRVLKYLEYLDDSQEENTFEGKY